MKILLLLLIIQKLKINDVSASAAFDKKSTRFYNLTKTPFFIDKTDFLGEFFLNKQKQLYFITCPHNFGKTIYIEMIKTFAGYELNAKNMPKNGNDSQAYEIFGNLSIGKNKKIMGRHLANHPVILVDFNVDYGNSWECFLISLQSYIKELFLEYKFIYDLYKKDNASTSNYQFMDKVLKSELNENETMISLKVLINLVQDFFNDRGILLVDHYDALVSYFSHSVEDINRIYEFVNGMIFQAFEEANGLQHGLIFGVSSLMFPVSANHSRFTHFPFLGKHKFTKYFGFTRTELKSLCKKYKFTAEDTIQMKVLFEYTSLERIKLYDPFSVTEYLKCKGYENSTTIETIESKYCSHKDKFSFISLFMKSSLFREMTIFLLRIHRMNLDVKNAYNQSKNVFEIVTNFNLNGGVSSSSVRIPLTYFFEHGFLGHETEINWYSIPNLEIDVDLRNKLKLFYTESKNMFGVAQLIDVLKEIILCPVNATMETKLSLNQTMHRLFEDVRKSEKHDFNYLDLIGLVYAFSPDMNIWACSEGIGNKLTFLKHKENRIMNDKEIMSKLAAVTCFSFEMKLVR